VVAVPSVTVVVRPGDSLWAIARRVAPDEDPRVVVDELEQARHDAPLVPGESITWTG
jgi:Tfp pilus assembly protein FimV